MPATTRQTPPKPEPALALNGILAGAVPVTTLREQHTRTCIYGRNRSGKTTLACQFKKPLLIISSEPDACGGATSVADMEGVSLIRISPKKLPGDKVHGSAKVVAIANELLSRNPFATVVFDTVTSLQDVILVELMNLPKVPEMMSWGMVPDGVYQQRAEKLRETLRPLLDLNNCNLVILAQEKDHNAPEDRGGRSKLMHTMQQGSFMAPALGATNAQWLQDACGYVVHLYEDEVQQEIRIPQMDAHGKPTEPVIQLVGTGKRQRHLRLLYHPNFAAGGRWRYGKDVPEYVTSPDPAGLYAAMATYVLGLAPAAPAQ